MKLHDYQKRMSQFIVEHPRCGIFMEMGLGKTLTVLDAIADLPKPVLIVGPLRVVQTVWQQESIKWGYAYSFSRITGTPNARRKAAAADADIHLINVENFSKLRYEYENRWKWKTIVFDESSLFKTPGAKRTRAALWASRRATRVVLLSGTPAPKSLLDLYAQIKLLDGGERLGRNMDAYKHQYFYATDYQQYNWAIRPGMDKVIEEKISDICVSLTADDYLDMPDMITNDIYVDMPLLAQRGYEQMKKEMYLRIKDEDLMAETAAGLIAKLQQLSSGSVYGEDKEVIHVHTAKMDTLMDIIEEANGQSVLIVYQFKHTLSRLRKKLGINFADVRDPRAIDDWNKGDLQLMGLHPASGGHGLNLQAGGHIIVWFDQTYNLEHYQQANARLHRQGQEHPVMVHRLICTDTIDSVVLQSLTDKTAVQDILMEGLK